MKMKPGEKKRINKPYCYSIRLEGHLDQSWSEWLEGLTITALENDETILTGVVVDQAALHGLLARIRDFNLKLISVIREREMGSD